MKHLILTHTGTLESVALWVLLIYEMNNTEIYGDVELADCCSYVNTRCFLYDCVVKLVFINEKRFNYVGK